MADVFISYKRDERRAVQRLAQELRELGLDVWFDASLNAGEAFSDEIDREANAAKAILVCWSPTARESQWVRAEALIGFERRKLAACYVAGPDGFHPPTPFNSIHAEDLRAWVDTPSKTHAGYKSILRRIGALSGRADIESYGALKVQAPASTLRDWIEHHPSSPLFMAVDELLHVREVEEAERALLEQGARERRAREGAEREERARQEREAQAARDAETERRERRTPWPLIIGGVVVGIVLNARQDRAPPAEQTEVQEQQEAPADPAPDPNASGQAYGLIARHKNDQETLLFRNTLDALVLVEVDPTIWHACPSDGIIDGRVMLLSDFAGRPPLQAGDLLRSQRSDANWYSLSEMKADLQRRIQPLEDQVQREWNRTGSFPSHIRFHAVVYGTNRSETGVLQSRVLCGDILAACSAGAGGTAPTCR